MRLKVITPVAIIFVAGIIFTSLFNIGIAHQEPNDPNEE
jgi:hypothetical protein